MSAIERSRRLRRDATRAEKRLWSALRDRQLGDAKFRRQHPLGRYIVDFFCLECALVIELDGGQHAKQRQADEARDAWLASQGYRVLRFWNHDVLTNTEGVLLSIEQALGACEGRLN